MINIIDLVTGVYKLGVEDYIGLPLTTFGRLVYYTCVPTD